MGISSLIKGKKTNLSDLTAEPRNGNFKNYYTGLVTNVLNPKVALFFLSFFPQFIARESLGTPMPFIVLGATYCIIGIAWFLMIASIATVFSDKLTANPKLAERLNKVSAIVYISMGLKIAFSKR